MGTIFYKITAYNVCCQSPQPTEEIKVEVQRHDKESLEQFFKHHGFRTQRRPVDMLWAEKPT
jgi:hypothetical protein